jgi:hypothetical protein
VPAIAAGAVKIGVGSLRCQLAVISEAGARIAEAARLSIVIDRCLKVEPARYFGRMHWLGFNTHRITSVQGGLQFFGRGKCGVQGGTADSQLSNGCATWRSGPVTGAWRFSRHELT